MENPNKSNNMNACAICSAPSKSKCSGCYQIYYCSVNHQQQDWKRHKPECHPFIVKSNEKLGRYLVASRDIKENEIILKETPLIRGPLKDICCVGCLGKLDKNNCLQCDYCGWPICKRECQNNPDHKAECEFTIKIRGSKIKNFKLSSKYEYLTIIRCLLLKTTNPQKWERLIQLEPHEKLRRNTLQWQTDFSNFEIFTRRFFKTNNWSKDEIMHIFGIIQINAFLVHLKETSCVGIFDYSSLFEHSCIPNVTDVFTEKTEIILWAPYEIKKGTHLSISYANTKNETVDRQKYLKSTKFFKCECERCKDITEFGTYYSALKCNKKDCDGLALPTSFETFKQDWTCNKCSNILNKCFVSHVLNRANEDSSTLDKTNMDNCKRYIRNFSNFLSDRHYFICDLKINILDLFNDENVLQTIDMNQLNYYLEICEEMINLYEKLAPVGLEPLISYLYYVIVIGLNEKIERSNNTTNPEYRNDIIKSLKYVDKTMKLCQYSPKTFAEGLIYTEVEDIGNFLRSLL